MKHKLLVASLAATALAGAACSSKSSAGQGSGGTSPPAQVTPATPISPQSPAFIFPSYSPPPIVPSDFTTNITNQFAPFNPGETLIYTGTRDGVPLRIEVTTTTETKTIMGVKCIVVRDIVTGALEERTTDWYAQDKSGNVWYFGEDTKEYANGVVTSTAGTWTAGVNGALPGIIMYGNPTPGDPYRQEYRPGVAEDVAQVVETGGSVTVPSGTYSPTVVTKDTDLLNPTKLEHKTYAAGVGLVYLTGTTNGHQETVQLASILKAK